MAKVIGCDLGTTNSVIAIKQADVKVLQIRENQNSIPSVVGVVQGPDYRRQPGGRSHGGRPGQHHHLDQALDGPRG